MMSWLLDEPVACRPSVAQCPCTAWSGNSGPVRSTTPGRPARTSEVRRFICPWTPRAYSGRDAHAGSLFACRPIIFSGSTSLFRLKSAKKASRRQLRAVRDPDRIWKADEVAFPFTELFFLVMKARVRSDYQARARCGSSIIENEKSYKSRRALLRASQARRQKSISPTIEKTLSR